jgi:hypothetical protein
MFEENGEAEEECEPLINQIFLIHFEILGGINMKENGINQPIKPWKME